MVSDNFGQEATALEQRLGRYEARVDQLERERISLAESNARIETSVKQIEQHLRVQNGRLAAVEQRVTEGEIEDAKGKGHRRARSEMSKLDWTIIAVIVAAATLGQRLLEMA